MLSEFGDLFQGIGNVANYEHKIKIDPKVAPVSQKLRRIPLSQVGKVNAEVDRMLEVDIIEDAPEASLWVSNLVIVPKKDVCNRVCCDFRDVNKAIIRERYVLPKVEDTLNSMRGSIRGNRIVIPTILHERILRLAHETHLRTVKIKQLLRPKFYWFGMDKDIEHFVSSCEICAVNQPLNLNTPLQPVLLPDGPWEKGAVLVDIVGPIENRYIYLLI